MANFYRFHVTGDYKGGLQIGGTRYVSGDTFDLTQDQVKQFVRWSDVEKGYLLYLGEMPADSTSFSSLVLENLKGKSYTIAKNYLPFAGILSLTGGSVAASGSAGVQGADLCWITLGQRVGITAIQYRVTTSSGATDANRFLVTAGKVKKVTPTTLRYYDSGSTAYGSMSNGDIDHNAPITWAANDLLIVGYTEKFRSVNVAVDTTRASAGAINQIYYWNGSAWAAFDAFTDYTKEPDGSVSFNRVIADDDSNIRVVWWDAPADWHPGGPAGSGVPAGAYVVAMRVSGALTALNGLRFYPMLDIPIADINVGEGVNEFDAQVIKVGANYTDETGNQTVILDLSTTDYLFLGYAQPWNGILLSMDAGNVNIVADSDISLSYWNGVAWSGAAAAAAGAWGGTVTDGTENPAITLAQDGIISWTTHPSDWNAVPYTSLDATTAAAFAALGTVTTDSLYWIRVSADDAITATTAVDAIYVIGSSVAWTDATVYNNSTDEQGEFHVHVIDEDATTALEIRAVVVDV